MNRIEMPIYLVALGEAWIGSATLAQVLPDAAPCFGSREAAQDWARRCAAQAGRSVALFRVVEYRFSGEVFEGEEEANR